MNKLDIEILLRHLKGVVALFERIYRRLEDGKEEEISNKEFRETERKWHEKCTNPQNRFGKM